MSTTSLSRFAASRRNALKSTGPKSPEDRAASRMNALKPGWADEGDLLAPDKDAALVEHRAGVFARELGAVGEVGELLAHRAALLSVRMDKLGERQMLAVAANKAEARARFDQERFDGIEGWINDLNDPSTVRSALESLEAIPEGVEYLILTWIGTLEAIRSGDNDQDKNIASARATVWLGLSDAEADASKQDQADRIGAEVARLRLKAESLTAALEKVDALRERAAKMASFDPSPEATLAHRHEAAAERGMYRAMRAIAQIRREHHLGLPAILTAEPATTSPVTGSKPVTPRQSTLAPLGSFRAGVSAAVGLEIPMSLAPPEPAFPPDEPRKKRPDLRKLARNRR